MKQIWLVTQREYLVQVKKKSFVLLTLLTPLLLVGLIALVVFLMKANEEKSTVAVIDESGLFVDTFKTNEKDIYAAYPIEDLKGLQDTLKGSDYLQGILHIPKTDSTFANLKQGVELQTNKNFSLERIVSLESLISSRLEGLNLRKQGISESQLQKAKVPITLKVKKQTEQGAAETDKMTETIKTVLASVLMYITFTFIMMYAIRVMRSVIEEKSNRVVEIIISSVKPFNLMLGKILGTTFMALTQFVIWIAIVLIAMKILPSVLGSMPQMDMVSGVIDSLFELNYVLIIGTFLIYFLFGYLLYSAFFAAIGASVDSETETQQFMWVGLLPLMLGVYSSISVVSNPDGPVGFWMSMIPFTSPVTMMARIPHGVPTWQLILSIIILISTVLAMVWFAAKIYRVGILMYGKKPSFKEWLKWIRY